MASRCKTQYFLKKMLVLHLLTQVLMMTSHRSVTEGTTQLKGELGGDVTFHCPIDRDKQIRFFYLQRGDTFVNGFHSSESSQDTKTWENTKLTDNKTAVHMYNLNVSHSGDYECHIQYEQDARPETYSIYLTLTGKYTKPEVTQDCDDKISSCTVRCFFHGGYPRLPQVTWTKAGNSCRICEPVNSSELEDPDTKTFNISSTMHINCSNGELKLLSCSIGNATSDPFSVCTPKTPPPGYVTIAICVVVFITFIVACLLWWKCKTRQRTAPVEKDSEEAITMVAMAEESKEDGS